MDIPALSMQMQQNSLAQQVSLRMFGMVKEQATQQGNDFVRMLERSVQPNLGGSLDLRA